MALLIGQETAELCEVTRLPGQAGAGVWWRCCQLPFCWSWQCLWLPKITPRVSKCPGHLGGEWGWKECLLNSKPHPDSLCPGRGRRPSSGLRSPHIPNSDHPCSQLHQPRAPRADPCAPVPPTAQTLGPFPQSEPGLTASRTARPKF